MDKRTSGTPQDGGTGDDLLPWLPLSRQQDRGQDQGHRPPRGGGAVGPRLPAPSWPSLSGSAPAGPGAPPPPGRAPAGPRSAGAPPTGSRTARPHQDTGPTAHGATPPARPGRAQTPPGGARRTTAPPSSPRAGLPSVTDADPSTIWAAGTYRASSRSTRVSSIF